jgi:hypothetical protein
MTIAEAIFDVAQTLNAKQSFALLLLARGMTRALAGEPYARFAAAAAQVSIDPDDLDAMQRAIDAAYGIGSVDE